MDESGSSGMWIGLASSLLSGFGSGLGRGAGGSGAGGGYAMQTYTDARQTQTQALSQFDNAGPNLSFAQYSPIYAPVNKQQIASPVSSPYAPNGSSGYGIPAYGNQTTTSFDWTSIGLIFFFVLILAKAK